MTAGFDWVGFKDALVKGGAGRPKAKRTYLLRTRPARNDQRTAAAELGAAVQAFLDMRGRRPCPDLR